MVSGDATTMTLPAKIVKNKEPITLALTAELTAVLKKQFRQTGQPVFDATNLRREWASATVAGAPASQAGVLSERSRRPPLRLARGMATSPNPSVESRKAALIDWSTGRSFCTADTGGGA